MSAIRNGFGNVSGLLDGGVSNNASIIINLLGKLRKRIYAINCSYAISKDSVATTILNGRVLVVGTKFQENKTVILPADPILPDQLSSGDVFFDMAIGGGANSDKSQILSASYVFPSPIDIPATVDASIILVSPLMSISGQLTCGFLNAVGIVGDDNKPAFTLR